MLKRHSDEDDKSLNYKPESIAALSQWFGIVVLGYGVVPLTYNFRESMAQPNQLVHATAWALGGVALSNILLGVGLYALFPNVKGEILHELGEGVVPLLTRCAMVGVVLFTTPLLIVPCSEVLEGKLGISGSVVVRDLLRLGIVAVAVFIAVLLPNFVEVFAFVGCTCGGLLGLCLPPLVYLRLARPASDWVDRVLFVLGVLSTIAGTLYSFGKL